MTVWTGFMCLVVLQLIGSFLRSSNDKAQRKERLRLEERNKILEDRVTKLRATVRELQADNALNAGWDSKSDSH